MAAKESASAPPPVKRPLAVHIVMHEFKPKKPNEDACPLSLFAARMCERLSSGERSPAIPVRLWRSQTAPEERKFPKDVVFDADRNLILVLIDQEFFQKRREWETFVNDLTLRVAGGQHTIIPLAIHADAARVSKAFWDVNHIPVANDAGLPDDERIYQAIYTALIRLLMPTLPTVFLCHAKNKIEKETVGRGEKIARVIRQYVYEETQLSCFFDFHDIPHGAAVKRSVKAAINRSVMLVVWTEKLLDSPWCQLELIEARRQQRPLVILDALEDKTPRLFPFLGNMPVIRWQDNSAAVVSSILLEVLRSFHLKEVFIKLSAAERDKPVFGLHPPDLLDNSLTGAFSAGSRKSGAKIPPGKKLFVYPDPPVKADELLVLQELIPAGRFFSLVEWRALRAADRLGTRWFSRKSPRPQPFLGFNTGVSVSFSDTWADLGLIQSHQEDITADIALELILLGTKIVWGGDSRPEGLGGQLKRIVRTYQHPTHAPQDHVLLYVPYSPDPTKTYKVEEIQARREFAEVRMLPCPVDFGAWRENPPAVDSAGAVALAALGFSMMRAELAQVCDARIVLGGGLQSFLGLYPGIAEEAYESVRRAGKPLYILGGFGGAARAVYETLTGTGGGEAALLDACHRVWAQGRKEANREHNRLVNKLRKRAFKFDPEAMIRKFKNLRLAGLSRLNGLSPRENEKLAESQNVHEILELLVRGLSVVRSRK
ncbi:MAG TPA: TIR domain-containing protein [Verrucomicrobiales bacterium]|nr:TIR domain-containing protein [Verrucomicrobiales bacterium]